MTFIELLILASFVITMVKIRALEQKIEKLVGEIEELDEEDEEGAS